MPLPVRSTSVRGTSTDSKPGIPRATPNAYVRKLQPVQQKILVAERDSLETAEPSVDGSETSSRIPSPFKRDAALSESRKPQLEATRQLQRPTGHTRQRSVAQPSKDSRPKFEHSRSVSTISTNTTATTNTSYTANTTSTSGSDQLRSSTIRSRIGSVPRPNGLAAKIKGDSSSRPTNLSVLSRNIQSSLSGDNLQNEISQLAIVYGQSAKALRRYQIAIEASLNSSKAALTIVRDDVVSRQQAFYQALNLEAVNVWLHDCGYQGTCQLVQNLSIAVRDLHNLEHIFGGEDGLASSFQTWTQSMTGAINGDVSEIDDVTSYLRFERHLGPELKRFKQQIASTQRIFSNLPLSTTESALTNVMKLHIALADSLNQQSSLMIVAGEALVEAHCQWASTEIAHAIDESLNSAQPCQTTSFLKTI